MKYVAGIDGGGTKTRLEIRSLSNEIIKQKTFGAFNINSIGEAQFGKLLMEIISELTPISDCMCICIGAAGISNPLVQKMISQMLLQYHFTGKVLLKGDHEIALHGALGKEEGIILISGTGSICYGKGKNGEIVRAGGWGHIIDDGGSAYAVARDGFSAVMRSCDARLGNTILKDYFFQKLGAHSPEEIIQFVYNPQTDKGKIAAFAPIIEQAALEGDKIAYDIICYNSSLLLELVKSVYGRLNVSSTKVALLGGMISHETIIRKKTIEKIRNSGLGLKCIDALADAVSGAVAIAIDSIT